MFNNFNEFINDMEAELKAHYGEERNVQVRKVKKNNGIELTGVSVNGLESNIAPTVYLDDLYKAAQQDFDGVVKLVIDSLELHMKDLHMDMSFYTEYEKVKDYIVYRLVNAEKNYELLKDVPNVRYLDMALIFYYVFTEENAEGGFLGNSDYSAGILVHNDHLKMWKKTCDELLEIARANTCRILGYTVESMYDVLREMVKKECGCNDKDGGEKDACANLDSLPDGLGNNIIDDIESSSNLPMYVISNNNKQYGATAIVYDGVLKKVGELLSDDFYILPSSVHEVIIVSASDIDEPDNLGAMVREINSTNVPYGEVLSDNVYFYNRRLETVEMA